MKLFWTFICMALLVACQNGENTGKTGTVLKKKGDGTPNGSAQELLPITELDGKYELASVELEGKSINIRAEKKVSISFERGKVNGTSICNSFGASFSLGEGNSLTISDFKKGNRICSGKIGKENNILSIFETARTYEIIGQTALKINSEKGLMVLRKML